MPPVRMNDPQRASVLVYTDTPGDQIRAGWQRRLIRTNHLMTAVLDLDNGPWTEPDPYHSHPHEQISYLAEGEILFLVEGEAPRPLRAGDLFSVPSDVPHTIQLLSSRARLLDTFHPIRAEFLPAPEA